MIGAAGRAVGFLFLTLAPTCQEGGLYVKEYGVKGGSGIGWRITLGSMLHLLRDAIFPLAKLENLVCDRRDLRGSIAATNVEAYKDIVRTTMLLIGDTNPGLAAAVEYEARSSFLFSPPDSADGGPASPYRLDVEKIAAAQAFAHDEAVQLERSVAFETFLDGNEWGGLWGSTPGLKDHAMPVNRAGLSDDLRLKVSSNVTRMKSSLYFYPYNNDII